MLHALLHCTSMRSCPVKSHTQHCITLVPVQVDMVPDQAAAYQGFINRLRAEVGA